MKKAIFLSATALSLSMAAGVAEAADPHLPGLTNQTFTSYTGSAPKNYFTNVDPTGWSKSAGGNLIFIDTPCTGTCVPGSSSDQSAAGPVYLQTYHNPSPNLPGNYVEADGNPIYENGFQYLDITGLKIGQAYNITFYQAASQQTGEETTGAATMNRAS
jgi:hypothetical protein